MLDMLHKGAQCAKVGVASVERPRAAIDLVRMSRAREVLIQRVEAREGAVAQDALVRVPVERALCGVELQRGRRKPRTVRTNEFLRVGDDTSLIHVDGNFVNHVPRYARGTRAGLEVEHHTAMVNESLETTLARARVRLWLMNSATVLTECMIVAEAAVTLDAIRVVFNFVLLEVVLRIVDLPSDQRRNMLNTINPSRQSNHHKPSGHLPHAPPARHM